MKLALSLTFCQEEEYSYIVVQSRVYKFPLCLVDFDSFLNPICHGLLGPDRGGGLNLTHHFNDFSNSVFTGAKIRI